MKLISGLLAALIFSACSTLAHADVRTSSGLIALRNNNIESS